MTLGMLCARRAAIVAALLGGFVIALVIARLCADGIVLGGTAFFDAVRSGLAALGL